MKDIEFGYNNDEYLVIVEYISGKMYSRWKWIFWKYLFRGDI